MNYYAYRLPPVDNARSRAKRAFLWLGIIHFVTAIPGIILGALINWRFVLLPLAWFCWGFVYGNIAYLFVTDYRYVYDNGVLIVYAHRFYGPFKAVLRVDLAQVRWQDNAPSVVRLTNCRPTVQFVYNDVLYQISCDLYMASLLKGEHYVFGQCGNDAGVA